MNSNENLFNPETLGIDLKDLEEQGYSNFRYIPGKGLCCLQRYFFTTGLVYEIDNGGYTERYCYHSWEEAYHALKEWDGKEHPSGNWIKHKGLGIDESNPLYEHVGSGNSS